MIKYIAYCRKSTDEPDRQILSIESQVSELQEFAAKENLKIVSFITESKTAPEPQLQCPVRILTKIYPYNSPKRPISGSLSEQ